MKKESELSLSLYQFNCICKKLRLKTTIPETVDVHDNVIQMGDYSVYCEIDIDGTIHRKVVATFNKIELENFSRYGDFIAINPTFAQ